MLSKEVCYECWHSVKTKEYIKEVQTKNKKMGRWWYGVRLCPHCEYRGGSYFLDEEGDPKECPHYFEHLVALGMTNAE